MLIRFAFLTCLTFAAALAQAQVAYRDSAQANSAGGQAAPTFVAAGAVAAGTGAIAPALPAGLAANDILLLFLETSNQAITIANQNGGVWAAVLNSPQSTGTAAGADGARLTVFWSRYNGVQGAPTTSDSGNHQLGRIIAVRGVITTGDPWDVTAGGVEAGNTDTSGSIPGATTTVPNTFVVAAIATALPDLTGTTVFSAQANGNLTGLAERTDNSTNQGNGGGLGITTGAWATTGGYGATTVTTSSNTAKAMLSIALRPPASTLSINVPAATLAGDVMVASVTFRPCSGTSGAACTTSVTPPAGWTLVNSVTDQTTGGGTGGFGNRLFVYQRVATGSEPANYAWSFGGALVHAGAVGGIISFSGVDTSNPVVVEGGQTTASSVNHAAPSIDTGSVTDTMLVSTHSANSSTLWTPPVGMTERVDAASLAVTNDLGLAVEMNHELRAAAGLTGARSAGWTAPPAADGGIAHMLALRPGFSHYAVTYPSGSSFATCEPALVRITAHSTAHGAVAPPAGTVLTINTSTADGVWLSPLVTGTGANWTPSGANNGQATYTWNGIETFIEARLRRNTAGSLHLNLTDAGSRSEDAGEDPSVTYAGTVLRITVNGSSSATVATQIAGKLNTEGAGIQTLFVQAVEDGGSGVCTTRFQNQTRAIEFAAVCNNPSTCSAVAGTEFQVLDNASSPVDVAKNPNTATQLSATYTSINLNFSNDANAMAPLAFRYGDAGQMTLFLRHTLDSPPATTILGTSNAFVVRPFGIAVRGANAGVAIAHGTTEAAAVLAAAGDPFTLTLAAYKWTSALEDANANGVPDFAAPDVVDITDNGLTPNFAADVSLSALSNLPGVQISPGVFATGAIGRGVNCASAGTVAAGSWSGGSVTINDACYSEAGNVKIAVFATDYIVPGGGISVFGLSSFDGTGFTGGHVGRFRPKHFAVSGATLANRQGAACAPASTFTYLDEPLNLTFTLTAQNAQNATTANYDGVYAKLGLTTFGNWALGARDGTTNLSARLDTGVAPAGSWTAGVASGVVLTTAVNRATPDNPDGPFTATAFGIAPVDPDSVAMNTLDLDVDNNAVMDRKNLGVSALLRYGRLRMQNALGSSKLVLPVPIRLEYWNGSAFELNTIDSCTTLARNTIALGSYTGALAPGGGNCTTFIQQDPVAIAAGLGTLTLAAPTGAVSGSVLLTPQLHATVAGNSCDNASSGEDAVVSAARPYLTGRWNDAANPDADATTAHDDNPSGRASFGVYGSQPNNYIYFRENY
ncbi:MAG: DUF6701 domain-containing protein [Betaproteobacteria bacterium]